jgi:hypothetical protein
MKKVLLIILVLCGALGAFAQNNVYGKKVVGLDSVVTNSINARAGDVVTVLTELAATNGLRLDRTSDFGPFIEFSRNGTPNWYIQGGFGTADDVFAIYNATTSTNNFKMETNGDATFSGDVRLNNNQDISFKDTGGTNREVLKKDASNDTYLFTNSNNDILLQENAGDTLLWLQGSDNSATFSGDIVAGGGSLQSFSLAGNGIQVVESGNDFPLFRIERVNGTTKTNAAWESFVGSTGSFAIRDATNVINPFVLETGTGNATFSGDVFAESGSSQDANIYFGETSTTRGLLKWDGTANEVSLTGITSGVDNGGLRVEGSSGVVSVDSSFTASSTITLDREDDGAAATIIIISDDGELKQLQFKNEGNSRRWNIGSTASSDADFFIEGFSNANVSQGNYFEIDRGTGDATFAGEVTTDGDLDVGNSSSSGSRNILIRAEGNSNEASLTLHSKSGTNVDRIVTLTSEGGTGTTKDLTVDADNATFLGNVEIDADAVNGNSYLNINNSSTDQFNKIGIDGNLGFIAVDNNDSLSIGSMTNSSSSRPDTDWLLFEPSGDATFSGDMTFSDYGSGSNTGTAAYGLAVDASGNVIENSNVVTTGSYTPTISNTSNISGTPNILVANYVQTGDIYQISIQVAYTATSTGATQMQLSLPNSETISSTTDVGGVGITRPTVFDPISCTGNTTNETIFLNWTSSSSGAKNLTVNVMVTVD